MKELNESLNQTQNGNIENKEISAAQASEQYLTKQTQPLWKKRI